VSLCEFVNPRIPNRTTLVRLDGRRACAGVTVLGGDDKMLQVVIAVLPAGVGRFLNFDSAVTGLYLFGTPRTAKHALLIPL